MQSGAEGIKCKKKLRAANAFKELVETFQDAPPPAIEKILIKVSPFRCQWPKSGHQRETSFIGSYHATTAMERTQKYARNQFMNEAKEDEKISVKEKGGEKEISNLELSKENLRQIQEEREKRHNHTTRWCTAQLRMQFENCDSSNLYLDNQSRNCYSCLGSIGLWPASRSCGSGTRKWSRGSNCFFVAYMSRRDAKCDLEHIVDKNVIMIRPPSGLSAPIRPILQDASVCQAEAAEDDFQGLRGSR